MFLTRTPSEYETATAGILSGRLGICTKGLSPVNHTCEESENFLFIVSRSSSCVFATKSVQTGGRAGLTHIRIRVYYS